MRRMYVRWTTYSCPSCGREFQSRVVSAPRVGLEFRNCVCGFTHKTGDIEWQRMRLGQRVEYFLSIWIGCWILFFVACGAVAVEENHWLGALYGFAIGLACASPFLIWKALQVKKSIERTSTTAQRFD
jgi:hypothetical protein